MSGVKGIKPAGKIIILLFFAAIFAGIYMFAIKPLLTGQGGGGDGDEGAEQVAKVDGGGDAQGDGDGVSNTPPSPPATFKVCLSQWPGHMAGPIACGGKTTQPGSFCDKVTSSLGGSPGINIEFLFVEDPAAKRAALSNGDCHVMWQTVDEMPLNIQAMPQDKLPQAFVQIDWSYGGDALVFSNKVQTPRDLLKPDVNVAGMKYTPDHTLFEFWLTNSDLSPGEIRQVRDKVRFTLDNPEYGQKLFCQGEVDVAFLWEPDTTNALTCTRPDGTKGRRGFSTRQADTLIADVLLAMPQTIKRHPAELEKIARIFLEGGKIGKENPDEAARIVSLASPRLKDLGDAKLKEAFGWVKWNTLGDNVAMFALDGRDKAQFDEVYNNANALWQEYRDGGKPVLQRNYLPHTLRTDAILRLIYEDAQKEAVAEAKSTGEAPKVIEPEPVKYDPVVAQKAAPVLIKSVEITFKPLSAELDTRARATLRNEVLPQLELAQSMSIRIEGNTDDVGQPATEMKLSVERAASVRQYLIQQGVNPDRLASQGNGAKGGTKPLPCTDASMDCRQQRRRTDIVFVSGQ